MTTQLQNHPAPEVPEVLDAPPAAEAPASLPDNGFMPVLSIQEAQQRFNALKQFVRENLRKEVDFGVIPGTGDKPTLLKPGAEKLCTFFGLRAMFEVVEHTQDWDRGLFNYWYRCRLFRGGVCIAEGDGSANSFERKYRWRSVPSFKASDEEKARAVREETRRSRDGRAYKMLVLENDDPYTLINTLQKMAQKRALIAATLIAVNASEYFTQDMEDIAVDVETPESNQTLTPESTPSTSSTQSTASTPQPAPEPARYFPGADAESQERQPELFGEGEREELTLKFRGRPEQEILGKIKAAGFHWDPKKVQWHAPATPERLSLVEDLAQRGALS